MPRENDKRWGELSKTIHEAARRGDWSAMKPLYLEQATILRKEKRNSNHVLTEAMRCDLMDAKLSGAKIAIIITSGDERVCPECAALEGKSYAIDEALRILPLPVKCPENWCRCCYRFSR